MNMTKLDQINLLLINAQSQLASVQGQLDQITTHLNEYAELTVPESEK